MAKNTKTNNDQEIDLTVVKEELKGYVDLKIKKAIDDELEKTNKRLLREKSKKILFRDIVILILLIIIGLLLFLMYKNRFFNKYLGCENEVINTNTSSNETVKPVEKEVTLEDLIKEHSHLLDNITINEKSKYINDYYSGSLSSEIKNYIAFNTIDKNTLEKEDDYNIINSSVLKDAYNKIFKDEYVAGNFNYLGNKVRYLSIMDSYITDKVIENVDTNIKREIIDIKVDNETIIIKCVEGIIKEDKLYNIVNNNEIEYNGEKLSKHKKELNVITYKFINEKLDSIK